MRYTFTDNRLTIDPGGSFLKRTVSDFFDQYAQSRRSRYLLIQEKRILLDDVPVRDAGQIIGNAKITVIEKTEEPGWVCAAEPCRVIYNTSLLYIVHKDPGIIIHGEPDDTSCLMASAAKWQADNHIQVPVRPIHRLDRDTQGLVFFSKSPFFQPWFDLQLKDKQIQRRYLAVCYGTLEPGASFICNEPLGKDRHRNNVYRVSANGTEARTDVTCIARKGPYVLLDCRLHTGRTHQIRVHLNHHGLPIVNDPIYGRPSDDFRNMGLWAESIEYRDPITRKKHRIHDEPADDFTYFQEDQENEI